MSDNKWKVREDMPFSFCTEKNAIPIGECYGKVQATKNTKRVVHAVNMYDDMLFALKRAQQFITNGCDFGYIKLPDDQDDGAHLTIAIIEETISRATKTKGNELDI